FIQWLRRPERFIQKLQAIYPHCQTLPFHNQEDAAAQQGVELLETTFSPKIEGITTRDDGQVIIVTRRGLSPLNRQFVIAHELGQVHLHLPDIKDTDAYSDPSRPLIPTQGGHPFRRNAATDSDVKPATFSSLLGIGGRHPSE
ncbi:MAG: hypothetical protein E6R14_03575, partial [Thermomicrobiales bacterium]